MTNPDPHPDSPPETDHDRRSDIERVVDGAGQASETLDESIGGVAPDGAEGENGAGGVVKNQDDMAQ